MSAVFLKGGMFGFLSGRLFVFEGVGMGGFCCSPCELGDSVERFSSIFSAFSCNGGTVVSFDVSVDTFFDAIVEIMEEIAVDIADADEGVFSVAFFAVGGFFLCFFGFFLEEPWTIFFMHQYMP